MKVSDLTLDQLDYWVARARRINAWYPEGANELVYVAGPNVPPRKWKPTRYWSQGGPLIEEARIDINWDVEGTGEWSASVEPDILLRGATALEAAMRAYVCKVFGPEVG
ncbi:MAG: DUF2591 domain-containing protein [Gammaproteobacteria bacterium]|nr:DUF2591 domain-containing protein [Gammaproteobacteria bacterium]